MPDQLSSLLAVCESELERLHAIIDDILRVAVADSEWDPVRARGYNEAISKVHAVIPWALPESDHLR